MRAAVAQPAGAVVVNAVAGDQAVVVDAVASKRPVSALRWVGGIEPGVEIDGGVAGVGPPERGPRPAPGRLSVGTPTTKPASLMPPRLYVPPRVPRSAIVPPEPGVPV